LSTYLLIIRRYCIYNNLYILCVLCRLAASRVGAEPCQQTADIICIKYTNCCIYSTSWWWANKHLKHVATINRNKLKANAASGWSYYTEKTSILKPYKLKNQQWLPINHWLWLTHGVACPDTMLHTYSDSKTWSPVMQECNVVSKRPTVAAPVMWDGLTDTVELLACHQLSLNKTHGVDRMQREQVSTINGTKHNSGVVSTCRNKS
jgi:hypothetical protein